MPARRNKQSKQSKRPLPKELQQQRDLFDQRMAKTKIVKSHAPKSTVFVSMFDCPEFLDSLEQLYNEQVSEEEKRSTALEVLQKFILPVGFEPTANKEVSYPGLTFHDKGGVKLAIRRVNFPKAFFPKGTLVSHELGLDAAHMTRFGDLPVWKVLEYFLPSYLSEPSEVPTVIEFLKGVAYNQIFVEDDPYLLFTDEEYREKNLYNDEVVIPYRASNGIELFFWGDRLRNPSIYGGKHMVDGKVLPFPNPPLPRARTLETVVTVNTNVSQEEFRRHLDKIGVNEREEEFLRRAVKESTSQFLPSMLAHFSVDGKMTRGKMTDLSQVVLKWEVVSHVDPELSSKTRGYHIQFLIRMVYLLPESEGYLKLSWVRNREENTVAGNILRRLPSEIEGESKQSSSSVVMRPKKPYVNFTANMNESIRNYNTKFYVTIEGESGQDAVFDPLFLMEEMKKDSSSCGAEHPQIDEEA